MDIECEFVYVKLFNINYFNNISIGNNLFYWCKLILNFLYRINIDYFLICKFLIFKFLIFIIIFFEYMSKES